MSAERVAEALRRLAEHEAEVKELRIELARLERKAELSVHHQVGVSTPVTFEAGWKSHAQTLEARLAEITEAARGVLTAEEAIEEGARDFDRTGSTATTVPADFWREVPCGHPADPVAWVGPDGPVCHCGRMLSAEPTIDHTDDLRHWPIVPCAKCGCYVAVPDKTDATHGEQG